MAVDMSLLDPTQSALFLLSSTPSLSHERVGKLTLGLSSNIASQKFVSVLACFNFLKLSNGAFWSDVWPILEPCVTNENMSDNQVIFYCMDAAINIRDGDKKRALEQ